MKVFLWTQTNSGPWQVERVLGTSNPDPVDIEKAKTLLKVRKPQNGNKIEFLFCF